MQVLFACSTQNIIKKLMSCHCIKLAEEVHSNFNMTQRRYYSSHFLSSFLSNFSFQNLIVSSTPSTNFIVTYFESVPSSLMVMSVILICIHCGKKFIELHNIIIYLCVACMIKTYIISGQDLIYKTIQFTRLMFQNLTYLMCLIIYLQKKSKK